MHSWDSAMYILLIFVILQSVYKSCLLHFERGDVVEIFDGKIFNLCMELLSCTV